LNAGSTPPTDDEAWALVNAIVKRGPQIASGIADYFGAEFHPTKRIRFSQRSKQSLVRKISRMAKIQAEISLVKKEDLSKPQVKRHLRKRFNQLLRLFDEGSIPSREDALRWQKWTFWWMTKPSDEFMFIRKTLYNRYHQCLLSLAKSIYYAGKRVHAESFLTDFELSPDARANVQAFFSRRLTRKFTLLDKIKSPDKSDVVKLVDLYRMLAGIFEKYVSVLVGLVEIDKRGVLVPFADVKRRQLSTNLGTLQSDGRFESILGTFDKTVRNALAHETWSISASKRLIVFDDLGKHRELNFRNFLKRTRELGSAVLALVNLRVFLLYVQFEYFDRILSPRP
jgi:hypothetical protein